jgi:hypothetical protein
VPVRASGGRGWGCSRLVLLTSAPLHSLDWRGTEPGKITRKSDRRSSRVTRSALAGDLARLHAGASGGWPLLQFARLVLIVAVRGRCGG